MSTRQPKVFIGYRDKAYRRAVYGVIAARLADQHVFMDVTDAHGMDVVERITRAVRSSRVVWSSWAAGRRSRTATIARFADPDDRARLEIETALGVPDIAVVRCLWTAPACRSRRSCQRARGRSRSVTRSSLRR